ncbi:Rrf2 family transcriptional regulator [Gilvimarinus agarilyticus]|uniref:Rrf2 family transcriptional regulator n=1 Tax=Gilvimarinus sp. 2_MG-2023 TaxID=3062666 RepID=UPI001C0A1F76|nr:Rrf2 family transcriptional regulator [Gilvimarinus sp. 2_MG-2023]MBU2887775.1 Rrf2 family transcriptional regulator [Gilvimarinus agarilyticus]MDO6572414.1 Rrf2 family transcriptional regulator [Gilvimarinus sp. 2_MG-2023]
MRKDSRLSRVLHVLIHLNRSDGPVTSETLANMLATNPVVVRRTMALLRTQGYVQSSKGHNGGWALTKPLADISLLDIHNALGESSIFTIGLTDEHDNCPIEIAVNEALKDVMNEAENLMLKRFGEITLDKLEQGSTGHPVNLRS